MKPIARLFAAPLLGVAALTATPAAAHEDPYSSNWCRGGEIVEVGTFEISGPVLTTFRQSPACAFETQDKDCGVFDDDYYAARSYSAAHCIRAASNLIQSGEAASVVPAVTGPASFLSSDHHRSYSVSSGLQGVCLACRPRSYLPPLPSQPNSPVR